MYFLEKTAHQASAGPPDAESSPLLDNGEPDPDGEFRRALDSELEKVSSFYRLKEQEIYGELEEFLQDEETYAAENASQERDQVEAMGESEVLAKGRPRRSSMFQSLGFIGRPRRASTLSASEHNPETGMDSDEDDADETDTLQKPVTRRATVAAGANLEETPGTAGPRRRPSTGHDDFENQVLSALYSSGITLKKRSISLYVNLCELKSFIQLNRTGFSKALKKYDKTLDRSLKSKYLDTAVASAYPFQEATVQKLTGNIEKIENVYGDVVTGGDVAMAKRELRLHLREHVVWERNTVWREMIGIERKAQAANLGVRKTLLGNHEDHSQARLQGDEAEEAGDKELVTPVGTYHLPNFLLQPTLYILIAALATFAILLSVRILETPEQQNCLAMLVFVSFLWATEVSPKQLAERS